MRRLKRWAEEKYLQLILSLRPANRSDLTLYAQAMQQGKREFFVDGQPVRRTFWSWKFHAKAAALAALIVLSLVSGLAQWQWALPLLVWLPSAATSVAIPVASGALVFGVVKSTRAPRVWLSVLFSCVCYTLGFLIWRGVPTHQTVSLPQLLQLLAALFFSYLSFIYAINAGWRALRDSPL